MTAKAHIAAWTIGVLCLVAALIAGVQIVRHRSAAMTTPPESTQPPATQPAPMKSPGVVYQANFTQGAGPEWSLRRTSVTRDQQHTFLGPFREQPLQFAIAGLPPHKFIRVTFDLITYDRWDGDCERWGPDVWDMRVIGGQPLLHTSFSNCGYWQINNEQSFPDQYPWYPNHPAWAGATTQQSLGYTTSQGPDTYGCDSTYAFDIVFPHSESALTLAFKSHLRSHANKPYGFLNFKVTTVDHAATSDEKTIAAWWNDLSDEDPIKAYRAAWSLISTGDTATTYIQTHIPPAPTDGAAAPLSIDQTAPRTYGGFEYATPAARQRARAIHVLEVIHSTASDALLHEIGYPGTPQGAPPDH